MLPGNDILLRFMDRTDVQNYDKYYRGYSRLSRRVPITALLFATQNASYIHCEYVHGNRVVTNSSQ